LFLAPNGLNRFDLKTSKSTLAFPHSAEAILFDITPSG
jgi:hypothetical protein